jgi:hypothetical protein
MLSHPQLSYDKPSNNAKHPIRAFDIQSARPIGAHIANLSLILFLGHNASTAAYTRPSPPLAANRSAMPALNGSTAACIHL